MEQEESPPVEVVGNSFLENTLFYLHINDLKFRRERERFGGRDDTEYYIFILILIIIIIVLKQQS
jgi:hypothetical protein